MARSSITVRPATEIISKVSRARRGRGEPSAIGGALEGAERTNRETALWNPTMLSPDRIINGVKESADARGRDTVRNDGYISGASAVHKDSIVGAQFRLNAQPEFAALASITGRSGFDDEWAEEFQQVVEARFGLIGDSDENYLDASGVNTFTGMIRLAIAVFLATGEVIATAEWVREALRPYSTAVQFIRSDRVCNPQGVADDRNLRRGVVRNDRGRAQSYWIRKGERLDTYNDDYSYSWINVPVRKPWGRKQVIHIIEQNDHDQTRGIADIVATLKNIRMTKRFREVVLQNAVVNATYAAAVESELPEELIRAAMGGAASPQAGIAGAYGGFMGALESYLTGSKNISVDGTMIPHLFPGTKMKMMNAGTPGGVGTSFEESLLRHTAATLGVSYESLSRDFSKTNYSSGRLAMGVQGQAMASRKRHVADRLAGNIYALQLEEMMAAGDVPLPRGVQRDVFYQPLAKEAFTVCSWIGSGAGQIDELKETQAAILRIRSGLSTLERESARLGSDWRKDATQRGREQKLLLKLGASSVYDATKPIESLADPAVTSDPPGAGDDSRPANNGDNK